MFLSEKTEGQTDRQTHIHRERKRQRMNYRDMGRHKKKWVCLHMCECACTRVCVGWELGKGVVISTVLICSLTNCYMVRCCAAN